MTRRRLPPCTCAAVPGARRHGVRCLRTAATQPHAMVDDLGQVFYPDNADDMAWFAREHGARFLDPAAGAAWLAEVSADPVGCGCERRTDTGWGEVHLHPERGCPDHPGVPAGSYPTGGVGPAGAHLPGGRGPLDRVGPR